MCSSKIRLHLLLVIYYIVVYYFSLMQSCGLTNLLFIPDLYVKLYLISKGSSQKPKSFFIYVVKFTANRYSMQHKRLCYYR